MQALARALFARCDIVLLDDCFSGLDGETENKVFENLFGPTGLFRQLKTTVVLVSNSGMPSYSGVSITNLHRHSSALSICRPNCGFGGRRNQGTRELAGHESKIWRYS
jgi:hypothetical protein